VYHAAVLASTTQGVVVTPLPGTPGTIVDTVGGLTPNQTAKLAFGVRITP
jgi:hypothetical protein